MPRRGWSSGWTGINRYALFRSSLDRRVPLPSCWIILTAWSMEAYRIEEVAWSMPSLMLCPLGEDKSTIRRHLPGWWGLGMTPIELTWHWLCSAGGIGPTNRPARLSASTYLSTTSGLLLVELRLPCDGRSRHLRSKPMWKPLASPYRMYAANPLSGWEARYCAQDCNL